MEIEVTSSIKVSADTLTLPSLTDPEVNTLLQGLGLDQAKIDRLLNEKTLEKDDQKMLLRKLGAPKNVWEKSEVRLMRERLGEKVAFWNQMSGDPRNVQAKGHGEWTNPIFLKHHLTEDAKRIARYVEEASKRSSRKPEEILLDLLIKRGEVAKEVIDTGNGKSNVESIKKPVEDSVVSVKSPVKSSIPPLPYKKMENIGQGSFGTVFKAEDSVTKTLVALKYFIKPDSADEEIEITYQLRDCPNVAQCVVDEGMGRCKSFIDTDVRVLVLKYYASGSMTNYISSKQKESTDTKWGIYLGNISLMKDVLKGLQCIHTKGYIYKDMKPDNVLVEGLNAYVGDFGLAEKVDVNCWRTNQPERIMRKINSSDEVVHGGTLYTMPYEIFNRQHAYCPAYSWDVWSAGITFLEVIGFYSQGRRFGKNHAYGVDQILMANDMTILNRMKRITTYFSTWDSSLPSISFDMQEWKRQLNHEDENAKTLVLWIRKLEEKIFSSSGMTAEKPQERAKINEIIEGLDSIEVELTTVKSDPMQEKLRNLRAQVSAANDTLQKRRGRNTLIHNLQKDDGRSQRELRDGEKTNIRPRVAAYQQRAMK
eukprot:g2184.t1